MKKETADVSLPMEQLVSITDIIVSNKTILFFIADYVY